MQRLARDTPTHASCTSSSPPPSLPPRLRWLAARPRKSCSRRRQQPSALTRPACLGYFQLPPGSQDASRRGGVEGRKKKEKERKAEAPTPVSSCFVLVSWVTPEETFHKCVEKKDRLWKRQPVGEPRCFVFHWTQWSIARFDHNGHKRPLMFEDINPCHHVCRQPSQQIFVVVGLSRFLNIWFYLTFFFYPVFFPHIDFVQNAVFTRIFNIICQRMKRIQKKPQNTT